ncbi:hypothetical protein CC78DRAFT_536492 [Lojkania enalia]|uniref:Vps72/YL1 N-terminal domain-containing protein n=1 Tax=Lojkania enalia TaxID=147567 RepID=A0A9P4K2M7_9PLEO|nr:hypothetical protein CC78DRAFT_536492 [Didymosphaeria enalia]
MDTSSTSLKSQSRYPSRRGRDSGKGAQNNSALDPVDSEIAKTVERATIIDEAGIQAEIVDSKSRRPRRLKAGNRMSELIARAAEEEDEDADDEEFTPNTTNDQDDVSSSKDDDGNEDSDGDSDTEEESLTQLLVPSKRTAGECGLLERANSPKRRNTPPVTVTSSRAASRQNKSNTPSGEPKKRITRTTISVKRETRRS